MVRFKIPIKELCCHTWVQQKSSNPWKCKDAASTGSDIVYTNNGILTTDPLPDNLSHFITILMSSQTFPNL